MGDRASRIAGGSAWLLGGQVIAFLAQFVYVGITSRSLNAASFGLFAVSAVIVALAALLTNGGLAQAVMRADELPTAATRSLGTIAVLLGVVGALLVYLSAPVLARLWDTPGAQTVIQLSVALVFLAPIAAFESGLARRDGRYKALAVRTAVATVLGLAVGAVCVVVEPRPESLVVGPSTTQALLVAFLLPLNRRAGLPGRLVRGMAYHLGFTAKVTAANMLSFVTANVGKYGVATSLGAAPLGQWNRAESITASPFWLVQSAIVQATYPELRGLRDTTRKSRRTVSDLLIAVAWITVVGASALAALAPYVVQLLLGPGWDGTADLVVVLAGASGLLAFCSLYGSVLEVREQFRLIYATQVIQVIAAIAFTVAGAVMDELVLIAAGLLAAQILRHLIQIWFTRRTIIDLSHLARGYGQVAVGAFATYGTLRVLSWMVTRPDPLLVGAGCVLTALVVLVLALTRHRMPPVVLLKRYGIL